MEAKKNSGSLNRTSAANQSGMHAGNTVPGAGINKGNAKGYNAVALMAIVFNAIKSGLITGDPKEYIQSKVKMYTQLNYAYVPFYIGAVNLGIKVGSPIEFCVTLAVAGFFPVNEIQFYAQGIEDELRNWKTNKGEIVKVGDMMSFANKKDKEKGGFFNSRTVRVLRATDNAYKIMKADLAGRMEEQKEKAASEKQLDDIIMCESALPMEAQVNVLWNEIGKRASVGARKVIEEYLLREKWNLLISVIVRLKYDFVGDGENKFVKELLEKVALIAADHDLKK